MSAATPSNAAQTKVRASHFVALTGNPNCGKTTLFNALTGLRAKVGNYAGVTVERKEGRIRNTPPDVDITLLDLPGTYSLSPKSLDEQVSRDVLFHRLSDVPAPAVVVVVVDASNLERNLYYATQVLELGYPVVVALNMCDVARENGHEIDARHLSSELGVPVVQTIASSGDGIEALKSAVVDLLKNPTPGRDPLRFCRLDSVMRQEVDHLAIELKKEFPSNQTDHHAEALLVLTDESVLKQNTAHYSPAIATRVEGSRKKLDAASVDWRGVAIEARYGRVAEIHTAVTIESMADKATFSDKLDQVLTHKVWGMIIFVAIMGVMFQSIFTLAEYPMGWIESAIGWVGDWVGTQIPPGDLHSLIVDGAIAGVGAVVVFLPQICLLFLFIGLLEDTGYMARAAFLMDRLMSKVGLHGKSFIPMLSSFACAIPGIMATRTIESPKDRLVTILVAPLMSCSARLPVYTLLIATCIPDIAVLGVMRLQGLTMLAMYLLGIVVALFMAWLFKKTLLKGEPPMLIMELPPYKRPVVSVTLRHMWDRSRLFLRRAGTVILGISILLWFLATYPRNAETEARYSARKKAVMENPVPGVTETAAIDKAREAMITALDNELAGERLRTSFAGRMGHMIEPAITPLGMDWKIGIGLVASFAAREVFVSTMSTVYNVGKVEDSDEGNQTMAQTLQEQKRADGTPVYTSLVGVTLMVFYVFALQCVSTVAVVRRETNSWKWPIFQWVYMGALAWGLAFITYQVGRLLGLG